MLTGKRAFEGTSPVSVMSAIMEREPEPLASLQPLTPPALDRLVWKLLTKDPDSRWQTASDVRDELRWLATQPEGGSPPAAASRTKRGLRMGAAAVAAAMFALASFVLGAWLSRSPAAPRSVSTQRVNWQRGVPGNATRETDGTSVDASAACGVASDASRTVLKELS